MSEELQNDMETTTGATLAKGIIGSAGPILLAVIQPTQLEAWMRIVSLGVGILVGGLTVVSLIRNMRRKP